MEERIDIMEANLLALRKNIKYNIRYSISEIVATLVQIKRGVQK